MKDWVDVKSLQAAIGMYLFNKVFITLVAFFARYKVLHTHSFGYIMNYLWIDNFYHWDSGWFQGIAQHGYSVRSAAFFPLFPALMHILSWMFPLDLKTVSLCIANLCFLVALYVVYHLIRLDYDMRETKRILWLIALYPTSYYFTSGYTESLYFMLISIGLYSIRRARWKTAGIAGFLAGVTRNTGVFLTIPFVLEYLQLDSWGALFGALKKRGILSKRISWKDIVWFSLIPLSIGCYMAYLKIRLGDAMAFSHAEKYFGRSLLNPLITLKDGILFNMNEVLTGTVVSWFWEYRFSELVFVGIVLFCLITGIKRLRPSYWLLLLVLFLIPLSAPIHQGTPDYFVSFSRYSLVMFPIYIALYESLKKHKALYMVTLVVFGILLAGMVSLWSNRAWVA